MQGMILIMPGAGMGITVMVTIASLATFASIPTLVFCFLGSAPGSDKSQSSQEPKTE